MADTDLLNLTGDIVAALVANNSVSTADLPSLIKSTYDALAGLGTEPEAPAEASPDYPAATTVRKSLADPNKLVSMIDGKPYSSLKRHLKTHGLTPADYRERYGLKNDYPMTAPAYSERRRELANSIGLGRKPKEAAEPQAAEPEAPAPKRGRPKGSTNKPKGAASAKAAAKRHLGGGGTRSN